MGGYAASANRDGPQVSKLASQRITLALRASQGKVTELSVHSSRSAAVPSWMVGAAPAEAVSRIGLAFALCRIAQRTACEIALEAAAGAASTDMGPTPERTWSLTRELLREHACNLFLSWPSAVGDDEQPALVRALRAQGPPAAVVRALYPLLAGNVLGMDPAEWLELDADGLVAWCARAATPTVLRLRRWVGATAQAPTATFLPPVAHWHPGTAQAINAALQADPGFGLRPVWQDKPAETGALARVRGHSLMHSWLAISGNDAGARMLARLVELAQWACEPALSEQGNIRAWSTEPGCGLSAVETSRGVLVHRVCLVDGRVASYSIIAPTEWNFHPDGLLRQVLTGASGEDECEYLARTWSLALDPCVDCSVAKLAT